MGTDGKNYFFELKHFSILFLLDENYRLQDKEDEEYQKSGADIPEITSDVHTENIEAEREKNQEAIVDTSEVSEKPLTDASDIPPADDKEDIRGTGAFVLFDESKNLFFSNTY